MILGLISLAVIALFVVPVDFDLEGNGKFKPGDEKQVFAHVDGEVTGVFVKHGDLVEAGAPLLQLKNPDLEQQISSVSGDQKIAWTRYNNARDAQSKSGLTPAEKIKNQQDIAETETTIKAKDEQLALLYEKKQKLLRVTPISGKVTTWDEEKVLNARPVVTGQLLMTIFNPNADWQIEILMPEKRMRFLDLALQEAEAKNQSYLDVKFILMTDPSVNHYGKLYFDGVSQRAELDAEDGAVVKLRCIPDREAMKLIKRYPDARVIADVKCGKRSAAFVWFHEVVEWVRANVWF